MPEKPFPQFTERHISKVVRHVLCLWLLYITHSDLLEWMGKLSRIYEYQNIWLSSKDTVQNFQVKGSTQDNCGISCFLKY